MFFGFQPDEEKLVMEDIDAAGCWVRGVDEDDWEVEEFHYVVSACWGGADFMSVNDAV